MTNNYYLTLDDVYTLTEIEEVFGIKAVTVKKALKSNRLDENFYKKSGATWLICKQEVLRLWGYKIEQ